MNKAKDPVCNMDVDIENAQYKKDYKGKKYYFCSAECMENFNVNPEKYIKDSM